MSHVYQADSLFQDGVGAWGLVDRALDSRSKGLGLISSAGYV